MLYFGSTQNFSKPNMKTAELAKIFRLPLSSVNNLIKRFEAQGKNIDSFVDRRHEKKAYGVIGPRLKRYLLNRRTLQS